MKIKLLLSLALLGIMGCNSGNEKKEQKGDVVEKTEISESIIKVDINNFVRSESDGQLAGYSAKGAFGKLLHLKEPYSVDNQTTIRGNRDTYYSLGVFDLTTPLKITKPESPNRFQSLLIVSQDHSIQPAIHGSGEFVFTQEDIGTRYVFVIIRTFINPNDPTDIEKGLLLQSQVYTEQDDIGKLELPNWDEKSRSIIRDSLNVLASKYKVFDEFFGLKENLDPDKYKMGAAFGWGGNPKEAAVYRNFVPEKNDGITPYSVTVGEVPVNGFWSISVYNEKGFYEKNDLNIYTYNNIAALKNEDGTTTINFGGDTNQINYMPIVKGWNYIVRLYQPKEELLNGNWKFPAPELKEN